jgi:hypothetical protein
MNSLLADGINGSVSSKRVVTLVAFLLCALAFVANLFWKLEVAQFMYESMMYIVLGGLTVTASEKFSSQKKE